MKTSEASLKKPVISQSGLLLVIVLVNLPLFAFSWYIHHSMAGNIYGDQFLNNFGVWLLSFFKIAGANIAMWQILREFKIKS